MIRLAIIADDLTGAADAAVPFAARSYPTHVLLDPAYDAGADVIAIATETRHGSEVEAAEEMRQTARNLDRSTPLYKKIDSTLRGYPATELFALMEATGEIRALIAPAFPAQGRTTVNGRQLLNGVALEQTEFKPATAQLARLFQRPGEGDPPRLIDLADVRQGSERLADLLSDPTSGLIVVDAETDADLDSIVAAAQAVGIRLLCGSAGLCHALARRLPQRDIPRSRRARRNPPAPTLTIAGSRHPATIAQVQAAANARTFLLSPENVTTDWATELLHMVVMQLGLGLHTIIETSGLEALEYEELAVAYWLSLIVESVCKVVKPGGLILTGGDIATFVCHKLGVRAIDLRGEVLPGIPWGTFRGGQINGVPVITKAGGFGDSQALVAAIDFLTRR